MQNQFIILPLVCLGGADEYWIRGTKRNFERSQEAAHHWNTESAKEMWRYYYHDVEPVELREPPENLLNRLENETLPEIESNMFWEAYYKMINEGMPYLFTIEE